MVARHNCVILPGIGAFLAHRVPAHYNFEDRLFMPPHRTLGFNPQVRVDDALLLSEYIACEQLSYEEASALLHKDIARFRNELSSKGTIGFGELGIFSMNINNEISFTPGQNGIDDPYNFGFEPLVMPLLNDHKKKDIVIKRNDFGKYIASIAAIIVTVFLLAPIGKNSYEPAMQASVTDIVAPSINAASSPAIVESSSEVCEIAPVEETVTENIITESFANEQATEQVAEQAVENTAKYYIIVASSPTAENAGLAIEELSAKVQAEYKVVEGAGRYRIAYGSYSSNSDAANALASIKDVFPDAWILNQ